MFAPTNTAAVFADLISDEYAFSDVALRHGTTAADLAAWLQTPAIAEQFNAITTAVAIRTRAVAIHALHNASKALRTIVEYFNDVQMHCVYNPANPKDAQRRLREFNTVRRASWLLYLISRTAGLPPHDRPDRPDRLQGGLGPRHDRPRRGAAGVLSCPSLSLRRLGPSSQVE